ncbi:MAG: cation transporter [Candidatus Roizmanbacteria bacterium]|nr:cation transporter [Candidatus Roizmanbacteria bacterium]
MNTVVRKIIKINGMHCTACAMSIDFDLEDLEGVLSVNTNYARQETNIVFDTKKVTFETIINIIKKTGYDVLD